jgi:transcriptional regulator with XRE-family HTH domain
MELSTPLYDIFRRNVERLLEARGWSRGDLADAMGVTPSYVSQILNGHLNVAFQALDKFAKALDVAPHTLLKPPTPRRAKTA